MLLNENKEREKEMKINPKSQFVWSVHFSSQAWLHVPVADGCCVPVGMNANHCTKSAKILFDNTTLYAPI